jgi:hypothetical protein
LEEPEAFRPARVRDWYAKDSDLVGRLRHRLALPAETDDVDVVAGVDGGARFAFSADLADRVVRVDDHAEVLTTRSPLRAQPALRGFV